jgi:hypothetical protein
MDFFLSVCYQIVTHTLFISVLNAHSFKTEIFSLQTMEKAAYLEMFGFHHQLFLSLLLL